MNQQPASPARSRWTIVILFVVFAAPAAGGWLWFQFGSGFAHKNIGTLYDPARPLQGVEFTDPDGTPTSLTAWRGSWLLAYVGRGACDDACLARLDQISRVRLSLSKNIRRVMPVYLSDGEAGGAALERIRQAMPTGIVASLDAEGLESLVGQLAHPQENPRRALRRVYLIDPIGNLVLSYESGIDPMAIRKDLARLLRVSQIG